MAEEFFNVMDNKSENTMTSSPGRDFRDFEKEWMELGDNFSVIFNPGNSPKDVKEPNPSPSRKRKIEEAEDSLILHRRTIEKKSKRVKFTQETTEEAPVLKKFREENPESIKFCATTGDKRKPIRIYDAPGVSCTNPAHLSIDTWRDPGINIWALTYDTTWLCTIVNAQSGIRRPAPATSDSPRVLSPEATSGHIRFVCNMSVC
uniref:Uncharacterized protein n=1 Tax=Magallana gigas TaxID=29159 RepID=K1QV45_MAGGI